MLRFYKCLDCENVTMSWNLQNCRICSFNKTAKLGLQITSQEECFRQRFGADCEAWSLIVDNGNIIGLKTKLGDFTEIRMFENQLFEFKFYRDDIEGFKFKIVFNGAEKGKRVYRNIEPYCYADSKIALPLWEVVSNL